MTCPRCGKTNPAGIHTCTPPLIVTDPHTAATQIAFAMRLADAPLSEAQFVTLCAYLKAMAEE